MIAHLGWVQLLRLPDAITLTLSGGAGWPVSIPLVMTRNPLAPHTPTPYYAHLPRPVFELLQRIAADYGTGRSPGDGMTVRTLARLLERHPLASLVYLHRAGGLADLLRADRERDRDKALAALRVPPDARFRGRVRAL